MTPDVLKEAVFKLCVAKLKQAKLVRKDVDPDVWRGLLKLTLLPGNIFHINVSFKHIRRNINFQMNLNLPSEIIDLLSKTTKLI